MDEPQSGSVATAVRPASALVARNEPSPERRFVVPRPLRIVVMALFFFFFFLGSPVLALVVFPLVRLFSGDRARDRCTHVLHRGMFYIARVGRWLGLAELDLPPPPPSVRLDAPYVLISNHPTYVDMIVILGTFEGLTCVTNGRWWRHWGLGRLLPWTNYIAGPGSGRPESENMLETMVAHLRAGHPLLIFPEGQRSMKEQLRRFRRGAVEAAVGANVPILPLFLAVDHPYLTKSVPLWKPPRTPPTYRFEWFEPISPADFDGDAKRIQRHLDELYQARFDEQLARNAAFDLLDAGGAEPSPGGGQGLQKS